MVSRLLAWIRKDPKILFASDMEDFTLLVREHQCTKISATLYSLPLEGVQTDAVGVIGTISHGCVFEAEGHNIFIILTEKYVERQGAERGFGDMEKRVAAVRQSAITMIARSQQLRLKLPQTDVVMTLPNGQPIPENEIQETVEQAEQDGISPVEPLAKLTAFHPVAITGEFERIKLFLLPSFYT